MPGRLAKVRPAKRTPDHVGLNASPAAFRLWYDHVRPHQHLQGLTPAEVWDGVDPPAGAPTGTFRMFSKNLRCDTFASPARLITSAPLIASLITEDTEGLFGQRTAQPAALHKIAATCASQLPWPHPSKRLL